MVGQQSEPREIVSLTPAVFHILLALADDERHGYGIMQAVAEETQGAMRLGAGTLYRSLRTMLANGLIAEVSERPDPAPDDERRRYYTLTDLGQRVAQAEVARLIRLVQLAQAKRLLHNPASEGVG